ncbi:MAG: hypothetical protein ABIM89_16905 [Mycobacteriales bacterium]
MQDVRAPQVREYLDRLDRALRDLPRDRRTEIVRDIQAHIDDALSEHPDPSATTIDELLNSVGTPEEIAAAAYSDMPAARPQIATRDAIAVGLLLGGGFLFGVGWFVGLALLWSSAAWTTRDKLIGTLLIPGGLAGSLLLGGMAALVPLRTSGAGSSSSPAVLGLLLVLLAVFLPIFTTFWLIRHARRTP